MNRKSSWLFILGAVAVLVLSYFLVVKPGCSAPPRTGSDTVYTPGKIDTIYIEGTPDTVIRRVAYPVYVERPEGQHFGKDSSTYTIRNENGSVAVTTYPATDSVRIEVDPIIIERQISRVDTMWLHQIDTLRITTTITGDQPWYDTFLTGFITAVLAVAGVVGAFAL